jgi:hypothetical protein
MTAIETAKATLASLKDQRRLAVQDIQAAREPHGLHPSQINEKIASLPSIDAAIADAEVALATLMKGTTS